MRQQLLLLEDVADLGRSGEVVNVKNGFARNFLLPGNKAVIATAHTLRLQTKLQEERAKQAKVDLAESEKLAKQIEEKASITLEVKVDPEGNLYGSVTAGDIAKSLEEGNVIIDKRFIKLLKPIKKLGTYDVDISLKENVESKIQVIVEKEATEL